MEYSPNFVTQLKAEGLTISVIPEYVGKAMGKLEKPMMLDRQCRWESPVSESVKFLQYLKSGKVFKNCIGEEFSCLSRKINIVRDGNDGDDSGSDQPDTDNNDDDDDWYDGCDDEEEDEDSDDNDGDEYDDEEDDEDSTDSDDSDGIDEEDEDEESDDCEETDEENEDDDYDETNELSDGCDEEGDKDEMKTECSADHQPKRPLGKRLYLNYDFHGTSQNIVDGIFVKAPPKGICIKRRLFTSDSEIDNGDECSNDSSSNTAMMSQEIQAFPIKVIHLTDGPCEFEINVKVLRVWTHSLHPSEKRLEAVLCDDLVRNMNTLVPIALILQTQAK
ncbi:protein PFC0760c-like [Eutrema salsugineum]|uniref:protein PFC0760c-like n=1 Tax=Eutrema salsugineum TaxID=72664 RepID=UPI000CED119A|nr:protein PFC0760c-like [Eutrema salsugineum]